MALYQEKCTPPFEYNNITNKCEKYTFSEPDYCEPDENNNILIYNQQTKLCKFEKIDGPSVISNEKTPNCKPGTIQMPNKQCKSQQPISFQEPNKLQLNGSNSFNTANNNIESKEAIVQGIVQEPTNNTSFIFYLFILFIIICIGFGVYYFKDKLFKSATTEPTSATATATTTTTPTTTSTSISTLTPTTATTNPNPNPTLTT